MFQRVLVGVDGRRGGRDAITLARQLTAPDGVITLAHIYGSDVARAGNSSLATLEGRAQAEALLEQERESAALAAQVIVACEHRVGRGLHLLAERLRADLLVIGSTSHGLTGRVLMGDGTRAGLSGAPCAIAIASHGYRHSVHELATLGVGYDGSPESEVALAAARELAAQQGSTVWALQVVPPGDDDDDSPIPLGQPEDTSWVIRHTIERPRQFDDDVEGDAICGQPREELVRFGENLDLLVVGSRGYGPLGRLFQGGVSEYLSRHAPCPLLILPRASLEVGAAGLPGRAEEPAMIGGRR